MFVSICPAPDAGPCVSSSWPGMDHVHSLCVSQPRTPSGGPTWWMIPGSSEAVHIWAATRQSWMIDVLSFCACVDMFWYGMSGRLLMAFVFQFVILALLITRWQVCDGKLFNTVAEWWNTYLRTPPSLNLCVCSNPLTPPIELQPIN